MRRAPGDPSERLLSSNATDFERRVLGAALQQRPSREASARMARALGVSVAAVGTAAAGTTLAAGAAAPSATAATGALVWPWISAGVIGLVVAGAVVGARGAHRDRSEDGAHHRQIVSTPAPPAATTPAAAPAAPPARVVAPSARSRTATTAADLGEQVAFIDAARDALLSGASRRALDLLGRYQDRYPAGSFRPEATAIRIEALMKIGRESEARARARRFIAEHSGTLLARRVAEVAGLTGP